MKILLYIVLAITILISGCVTVNVNPPATTTIQSSYTTAPPTILTTIATTLPTPLLTSTQMTNNNQQSGSSNYPGIVKRIPVMPAKSIGNQPNISVKAAYSTVSYAENFAYSLVAKYGLPDTPMQTKSPLIHVFTDSQDSKLDLTNRDNSAHVYYVEVYFYNGNTQLISNTGQWRNNAFSWYVQPEETVHAELIPPENADSYVIKSVDLVGRGRWSSDYDIVGV